MIGVTQAPNSQQATVYGNVCYMTDSYVLVSKIEIYMA